MHGEPEKESSHPPSRVDKLAVSASTQDMFDAIPSDEFEISAPQPTVRRIGPGEATQKFLAATSTRLKALIQGQKPESDELDHGSDYDLPATEYLTSDPQSTTGSENSGSWTIGSEDSGSWSQGSENSGSWNAASDDSGSWTLPESTSILQEKKIKKEFLQRTGAKSVSERPTKTRTGTYSKPKKVNALEKWISSHKTILIKSGLTVFLTFSIWQIGHLLVASQLVNNGSAQLSSGHPDDALATFDQAIEVDGQSASAYFNRGNTYRIKGQLGKALDDYSTSLKLSPNNVDVLNRRASLCLKLDKPEQAADDYTVLLGLVPAELKPKIYATRADAYAESGQYEKALQDYDVALKANAKDPRALPGSAFCLLKLSQYAAAISKYNQLVEIDSSDYESRLRRGHCYQKQKNFGQAAKDFQTVLRLSPGNKQALYYQADLCADQDNLPKAFSYLASALQADPKYAQALMLRADLYSRKGDYANAVKDYDLAEKGLSFKDKLALCLNRAGIYKKMNEYSKAVADYSTAIRLTPKDHSLYLSRAECFLQFKDYKQSIADCTTAAKLSPKNADSYQLRGAAQELFGNPLSAYSDYSTAITLDGNSIDSYVSRGQNSFAKQDYAAALADFDQALKIDSKNAAAQAGRSQAVAATTAPKTTTATMGSKEGENVSAQSPDAVNLDLNKLSTVDLIKRGYEELQKGSADQSISLLTEAVRRNRNDPFSRRYLGYALLAARRPSEAIGQFEALRKLGSLLRADQLAMQQAARTAQAMQLEQSKQSEQSKIAEKSKESEQSKTAEAPKAGGPDTETLIAKYRAAILANTKDFDSKYNLAVTYSKAGRNQEAIQQCLSAISDTTDEEQQKKFFHLYQSLSPNQNSAKLSQ